MENSRKAVLVLGHGSKAEEANETLRQVAASIGERGGYGFVIPAFLQLASPDIKEAIETMVGKGYLDITVMPYFLYMGLHVKDDIPAELEEARKRHPGLKVTMTRCIGFDERLVSVAVDRIDEAAVKAPAVQSPFSQHPIEKESFRILSGELDEDGADPATLPVIKRVIHTTADFEFRDILKFSPGAVEAGIAAIRSGCDIITDVKMVESGITGGRLKPFGITVRCFSSDSDTAALAASSGTTKTAASMRKAAPFLQGSIVAIGNAPTALSELLKIIREGGPRPALIVGVPVGFVGAEESKDELMGSGLVFIASKGRKGGSTVAAAIVNALLIEAGLLAMK
ncbi:MAG TPA: precorrin-8X methylmutase [Thermodesulfobacteriota bacterium]|nr:precorrin-8X methylmutase [Thermodesulfobacteriota bacterium]